MDKDYKVCQCRKGYYGKRCNKRKLLYIKDVNKINNVKFVFKRAFIKKKVVVDMYNSFFLCLILLITVFYLPNKIVLVT